MDDGEALYEIVSCGGDADSVSSVAGSLVGALNGTAVFPPHLVDQLECADRLVDTANRLCDLFGIRERDAANAVRRVLHVVQADVVHPVGEQGFAISEFLLSGVMAQVQNRQHRYITGTVVTAPNAAALADAIERIEQTQAWELASAMNGDPSGEGITAFCVWLRRGGFEMVEERENVDEKT